VTAGLNGSLSFVMVVGWWSACAVGATLRAAGVGIVCLTQNHRTADEHLGRKKVMMSQLSGILHFDQSVAASCWCMLSPIIVV